MRVRKQIGIYVMVLVWLTAFPLVLNTNVGAAPLTIQQAAVSTNCVSRDPVKNLACLKAQAANATAGVKLTERFDYNTTAYGHLSKISEVKVTTTKTNIAAANVALPTNEIYRTAHWIWFSDPTIYAQNKAYIDPLLNWPETSYVQISQWLGLTLPPGSFDGGRRAIYIDSNPGYFGWTSAGNIGISYQVFGNVPDWPWIVIPHETANMFTGEGVTGGWPTDWWADGRSPFPAMVAVQVEKAYNVQYWSGHDSADSNDPQYIMFRDQLLGRFGWSLFQTAFWLMKANGVNLANIHSEYENSNWLALHYLKSNTVAYYLSRAAGVDVSSILAQGTIGTQPPGWGGTFYAYQINLNSILPTAQIQSPTGVQHGTITVASSAQDPDWGILDQTFWWSTDGGVFYYLGTAPNGQSSINWDTTTIISGRQNQVWVMSVAHDFSGFESAWSVSSPFTIDNTPPSTFDFALAASGNITVTQGNPGTTAIEVTLTAGQPQTVALSCTGGLPTGAACLFNPPSWSATYQSALTITTSPTTPVGVYVVSIAGTASGITRQTQISLTVSAVSPPFDFSISPSPSNQTITAGQSATYSVQVGLMSGTPHVVSLTVAGCPSGATCSFNPLSGSPTLTSTLTITTAPSVTPSTYPLTITATDGSVAHHANLILTILSPPPPFTFSLSNSGNVATTQKGTASNTISISSLTGITQPVTLSCTSSLPAGVSCAFNPASGSPPFSSILAISTSASTPIGAYNIQVTGVGNGYTATTQFTLSVSAPVAPYIMTDKITYSQGDTIQFIGHGFTPGGSSLACLSANDGTTQLCVSPPSADGQGNVAGTIQVGTNVPSGADKLVAKDLATGLLSNTIQIMIASSFDFALSNSGSIQVVTGSSGSSLVTVTLLKGQTQIVTLTCGAPSGVQCSLNPQSSNAPFTSSVGLTLSASLGTGTYQIIVTGSSNGISHATQFTLTVTAQAPALLTVVPVNPQNVASVNLGPLRLQVQVLGPAAIQGASVMFYMDGSSGCSGTSDSSGYYSCNVSPTQGRHTWYATVSSAGYSAVTSPAWSFTTTGSQSEPSKGSAMIQVTVSPTYIKAGSLVTFTVKLTGTVNGQPRTLAGRTITFTGWGTSSQCTTKSDGTCKLMFTAPAKAGTQTLTFQFLGDSINPPCVATIAVDIKPK
jgi:hypothetical protein